MQNCTPETHDQQPQIDGITPYFPSDLENYAPWVAKHGLLAPYGQCQCCCKNSTAIAKKGQGRWDTRTNHPYRYCHGHSRRVIVQESEPALCACGCGGYTKISPKNHTKLGQVKGQPRRYIKGHHQQFLKGEPAEKRFWEKVNKSGPVHPVLKTQCWEWAASTYTSGYGQFWTGEDLVSAHRYAYTLEYGSIPDGVILLHICDNPACVRSDHLRPGTNADNTADMISKGRAPRPRGGKRRGNNAFTDEQAKELREEFARTDISIVDFAKMHDVHPDTMWKLIKRKRYAHVTP